MNKRIMKKLLLSIVCVVVVIAMISCGGSPKQLTDQEILVKIYEAMNGPNWKGAENENWLSDKPIEEWSGVKVNDEGRVIELRIKGDSVRGFFPAEIGGLSELENLYLFSRECDVPSVISPEIGKLTKLNHLTIIVRTKLGSDKPILPNISTLVNLEKLYVEGFGGSIPENISQLSKLGILELHGFDDKIPESISKLAGLEKLFITMPNQPDGGVPDCIGKLSNLKLLSIEFNTKSSGLNNEINAKFPESIWDITNLENLTMRSLSNTGGPIPSDKVAKMTNLKSINISNCGITGTIPVEFFASDKLFNLDLSKNKFTGSIPSEIANCPKLSVLNLSNNQLTGNIPVGVAKSENFSTLNLSNNQLTGNIPEGLGKYKSFFIFDLSGNQLSPNIPVDLKAHPDFSKFKF